MSKQLDLQTRAAYEKIANMKVMNVANSSIAEVMGVSESAISQILQLDDYTLIYANLMQTKYSELQETDNSWDTVERLAIGKVKATLEWAQDPEFALRAAAVANKAQRRGKGLYNDPLPAAVGTRVHISLSQHFVTKLNQVAGAAPADPTPATEVINAEVIVVDDVPKKLTNSLATGAVKKLFGAEGADIAQRGRETTGNMIDAIFAGALVEI